MSHTTIKDGIDCLISKDYFYKTESYYELILKEISGKNKVFPSSNDVLDAYIVPVTLKRAELSGIPIMEWEISSGDVPNPAIVYSVNYFSDPSTYYIVKNREESKRISKHVTNCGKYPLCYQKVPENFEMGNFSILFGQACTENEHIKQLANKIYQTFKIPLINALFVFIDDKIFLSSLSPVNVSKLSKEEKIMIEKTLLVD
ncbi:RimK-like ATPgrasp N-terminal domain-containing protein [Methanococcus maripaludis]|nr:RimK-like ATPgrasp N-terminal domain-containing protein [Methanococcus maripaludis]